MDPHGHPVFRSHAQLVRQTRGGRSEAALRRGPGGGRPSHGGGLRHCPGPGLLAGAGRQDGHSTLRNGVRPAQPIHRRSLCADGRMPGAMCGGFQRAALSGVAGHGGTGAQEDYERGPEPGHVLGIPFWAGPGVFSRLCQRGTLQAASGVALRRVAPSRCRGIVQGLRQGRGYGLPAGFPDCGAGALHQREALSGLNNSGTLHVEVMSRKLEYPTAADEALVKAAQRGEMLALEEMVARHRDNIFARAFSMMRNEEEAIDLSQEAWVKGWQRLKQFQGEASFLTWMTRIVINLCLDQLRRQKRLRAESIDQMDEESGGVERHMPVVTPNPTERLERSELRQRIDKALGQLSYEHRTALVLHEFEDLEYKEIAKRMGCSIGTVMSRLFYARRKMAVLLAGLKREEFR